MNNHDIDWGVDKRTTWFIVGSQIMMMVWSFGSSLAKAGPTSAAIITYLCFISIILYGLFVKNRLILLLLAFGFAAGVLELFADHYSISTINALIYPGNEPMIYTSPLYMPFAWANVFVQLGYYSLLLTRKKGLLFASIAMAILGGMYIPFYENFAKDAEWWWYENVSMFWNAPYYIIICEALISLALPLCTYMIEQKKSYLLAIGLGVLEGLWIWGSAIIAYFLAP
ncbi:DUF6989 domain-containing protein [Marinigracilibium pacificum]|uniref:DUF6989 domain-containing protein n=1 Tax=Marinigracilibium pacificum TaxID=2729599 RepID=A0A848IWN0_9BACT|nr:hypothetical protein [Marinigracilibium pacificum]NMM47685.1 hypothetical protein [Marinigracilibium pacificum]